MAKQDISKSLRSLGCKALLAVLALTLIGTAGYLLVDRASAETALALLAGCPITPNDPTFYGAWQGHQGELGCPINQVHPVSMAEQPFLRGRMYWRSDTRQIYAIYYDGNDRIFQDQWYEGMPEDSCPGVEPPGGGERPIRGFGKVWCENPDVRAELGGGIHKEENYDDLVEDFENGVILRGSNRVTYVIPYDGAWFKYLEGNAAQAPLPALMYQWSWQPDPAGLVVHFDLDLTTPGDQQIVTVPPGTTVNGQIEFQAWGLTSGEIGQVVLFYSWGSLPPTDYKCLFNGGIGVYQGTHKTLDFSVTAPNTPGMYHLWVSKNAQYDCSDAANMIRTFPPAGGAVGVINVQATPAPLAGCPIIPNDPTFYEAWQGHQGELGCPINQVHPVSMAEQPFLRGRMYWRSDTRQIYAIYYDGNDRIFQDEWYEGMPEDSCPGVEPPGGGERPIRGFGKVWCENPDVRAELGGGIHKEESYDDLVEDFENGVILRGSNRVTYVILYNGTWFK